MITLRNEKLQVRIHPKGAELQSLFGTGTQTEYLWKGDPAYWGKHSPVLFPVIGALRNDRYRYNGREYTLPRHGFARDLLFTPEETAGHMANFVLHSSAETRQVYPFDFILRIRYHLAGMKLQVTYEVCNPDADAPLYFSVGGHPAFALPLEEGLRYEDYHLEFEHPETAGRWRLRKDGLITGEVHPLLEDAARLPLQKSLFYEDAIVLKGLRSRRVSLLSAKEKRGVQLDFGGFPYLGIWAARDAPFICLEPWCGLADTAGHNGELTEKEGIIRLSPRAKWEKSWSVTCF
ncbi:aldose 1-epimerase family protein [Compostibacter hankyongensis]|uniref:Aldose 1-epimerase family protein n=1 Tax=Compostibacter hankyongensis TaxID=1007089 RepID=A0ABP8FFP9_9BACT